ncbi:MAG: hypothetical protein FJY21_01995 [Bacteroidetes bacterium]|nr:hypothetical protein [Bacteroidota bacterium]
MAILITAASSANVFKLQRLLYHSEVFFAEQKKMPFIPGKIFIQIPEASSPVFISQLIKICLDYKINEIHPLKSAEIIELSKAIELFSEYGISILKPSEDLILGLD